jgi:glycerol-3-phosphate acyltransferase PlsY
MNADEVVQIILVIVISYLLGSIPTAYLVARRRGLNIFEVGSGNMGATNVTRSMGWKWGLVVWAFDSSKGVLAIIISRLIFHQNRDAATAISATAAIVGHNWSLFAGLVTGVLKGGKGAAIWFGTMFMFAPLQVLVVMSIIGAGVIALTRYVSLGVLGMFFVSTLWIIILISQDQLPLVYTLYALLVTIMIVIQFRENIWRLMAGTERRLGESA